MSRGRGVDGDRGDEFITETRSHGARTESLWPARLRRAGRIGQDPRIQVASIAPATCIRGSCPIRAARSAAPQAFSRAAVKFFEARSIGFFSVRPPCLRVGCLVNSVNFLSLQFPELTTRD